jgi:hypothetical protein
VTAADPCPTGDGGNSTITNQNEQAILNTTVTAVPVQNTALGTEDDSHVSIGYKDADVVES